MGYDVHIIRNDQWFEKEGPKIGLDDWLKYVDSDPTIRHDGFAETTTPEGDVIRINGPGLAVWIGYTGFETTQTMVWFSHRTGKVSVKNPDQEVLIKMHSIAQSLGAKVQGDEGEEYDSGGLPLL